MADYIYLVENRLSPAQLRALSTIRNIVRSHDFTLFLTGGAVRDLTGGGSVRDLDFTVQGDALSLRVELEASGARFDGENTPAQALFFTFPGGVRAEISSAMSITYAKPGVPTYHPSSIIDDLRRRDFTANAMALSLNEGSYGLLMDPLNGVADIENRELRLVSNYGFIEDPSVMIRAVRLSSRLGLHMEERTRQRYDNAKDDDAIKALSRFNLAYELEEIFHEEDPLRAMRALDAEGWLKVLSPKLQGLKANEAGLADLRDKQGQLQTQGILSDASALSFSLLADKLPPADVKALKAAFARPGFVREIDTIEERTRELQTRFAGKDAGTPSVAWRVLHEAEPDLVLSMFFTAKTGSVPSRLKTFLTESPTARQRIPYAVLQEMRITPDLPVYAELLDKLFFELMDGKLATTEELKAYLEPYSPPAPPPTINLRRARTKKEARPSRAKAKKAAAETVQQQEEAVGVQEGILEPGVLTGPDRGTEPTATRPIEGSVAPLATGEAEAVPVKEKRPAKKTPVPPPPPVEEPVTNVAPSAPAKRLAAKPAPAAKKDAKPSQPPPVAAKEIASKQPARIPQGKSVAGKGKEVPASQPKKGAKSVALQALAKKAAAPAAKKSASVAAGKPAVKAVAGKAAVAKKAAPQPVSKKTAPPAKGSPSKQASRTAPVKAAAKKVAAKKVAAKAPAKKSPAKKSPAKKAPLKSPAKKTSARR